jgi:N-acetylmuramic acid 6-phosphate etherase
VSSLRFISTSGFNVVSETMAFATEQHLAGLEGFDAWQNERILASLVAGQHRAVAAVERAIPSLASAADAMVARLQQGGTLFYAGAGTSIRVAVQDGSELPATFGFPEQRIRYLIAGGRAAMFDTMADAEDDAEQGAVDAMACGAQDCLVAVAASGRTPYTIAVAKAARANGCLVIAVVNNAGSALAAAADIEVLLESGPEVISGSTRLGAGTAQKAALNLLSTLINTRLGAVHDGYMVNVEAGNKKLVQRAASIVSEVAGTTQEEARIALEKSKGLVKPAVLLLSGAPDFHTAQRILTDAQNSLRLALARLKTQV